MTKHDNLFDVQHFSSPWTPAKSPKSCFKKHRFKGRGMMNGGGVDVALAEQGFDTFKLLESLDIPYDELLKPTGEFCSFATSFCWV